MSRLSARYCMSGLLIFLVAWPSWGQKLAERQGQPVRDHLDQDHQVRRPARPVSRFPSTPDNLLLVRVSRNFRLPFM